MTWNTLLILSPIIALFINALYVILLGFHGNTIKSIFYGCCYGLLFDGLLFFCRPGTNMLFSTDFLVSVLTYLALSFCFFAYLNLNMTSIRIRIIRELLPYPNGVSIQSLNYTPDEMFERRLIRLQEKGHIKSDNQRWILQSHKFLPFVWVSNGLRKLIMKSGTLVDLT